MTTERDRRVEESEEDKIIFASQNLLSSIVDINDTLFSTLVNAPMSRERDDAESVNNTLLMITNKEPEFQFATARKPAAKDRIQFLDYEHSGITMSFAVPDNRVLRINVYGGLRKFAGEDMRDSDIILRQHHTKRTDSIVSKPTFINWHLINPDGSSNCDVWLKKTQSGITIFKIFAGDEFIDVVARLEPEITYNYEGMVNAFNEGVKTLTKLIPSAI